MKKIIYSNSSLQKVKITVFDANNHVRNHIVSQLTTESSFEVVGEVDNLKDCTRNILDSNADIVVLDTDMPSKSGNNTVRFLKDKFPHVQILVCTGFEDDQDISEAILAGASGYILKRDLNDLLINAIRELKLGGAPLSPAIGRRLLHIIRKGVKPDTKNYGLTKRECQVLTYLVMGLDHKSIGEKLEIRYYTVRSHIKNIYGKLGVSSLTETVAKVIHEHLV